MQKKWKKKSAMQTEIFQSGKNALKHFFNCVCVYLIMNKMYRGKIKIGEVHYLCLQNHACIETFFPD